MPDNDDGRFSLYHAPLRLVGNFCWINFRIYAMSVALLALSSVGTFSCFFFPLQLPPVKSLIVIISVVKELNYVVQE